MVILNTLEVRWFLDESNANASTRARDVWFQSAATESEREDRYFLTDSDGIGIKVRKQGDDAPKLETKYRLGSLGVTELHERFAGHLERWRKLTTTLDDEIDHDGRDGAWLAITKRRRLRKLACEDGVVKEVDPKTLPTAGCNVEQTELAYTIGGKKQHAVTIGLEAFGPEGLLVDVLLRASTYAFDTAKNVRLLASTSASYPAWLMRIANSLRSGS